MPCTEPGNNRSSYLAGSAVNAFGNLSTSRWRLLYSLLFLQFQFQYKFQFQFLFHFWGHVALSVLSAGAAACEVMHLKSRRVVFMVIGPLSLSLPPNLSFYLFVAPESKRFFATHWLSHFTRRKVILFAVQSRQMTVYQIPCTTGLWTKGIYTSKLIEILFDLNQFNLSKVCRHINIIYNIIHFFVLK